MGGADGRVSRRQWVGLLLGFSGLVLVVSRKFGTGGAGDHADWVNLSFAVVALLSITVGTLYQKRYVQACDVRSANTVQLIAALLVTLPLALLESESMRWNVELAGALAWSVLVLTLGGSSLLYLLIQRGAAAKVTSLMYLVPPCTALIAWVLFDEPINGFTVAGIALTALGVSLVVRAPKQA
jgi:drug/metabolite transporter (DMT)-like permease